MNEIDQFAASRITSVSHFTRGLASVYHFLVAAVLVGALLITWKAAIQTQVQIQMSTLAIVVLPLAALYFVVGMGILRWGNWSRYIALILNWLNLLAALFNVVHQRLSLEALVGVLLSCFLIWWLSVPAVKREFQANRGKF